MAHTVPAQHPAVVLRSHYRQLRALLAIAMIAVIGLTITVVILATDDPAVDAGSSAPVNGSAGAVDGPRFIHSAGQHYDSSRQERTRGLP